MPSEKSAWQTSMVVWSPLGAVQSYQTVARVVNPGAGSDSPASTVAPRLSPIAVTWAPLPRSWVFAKSSLGGGGCVKVAVTERAWLMVTWQGPVPEQSPDQPAKVDPGEGVAVRVTGVAASKRCWQMEPQAIPAGLELTESEPLPDLTTVRRTPWSSMRANVPVWPPRPSTAMW